MVKKVLFALFVVSAVAAGSYGYIYLRNLKKPRLPATTLIPAHCTFVVESEDLIGFFKKLNETNLIWNEVQEIEEVNRLNQHYHLLDSIAGLSEKIAGMFSGNKVYMAAYPDEHDKYRFIFAMNLPDINYTGDVQTFLKTHAEKQEIKDLGDGQKMQELHFKNITQSIWFYLNAGVLVASADQELLTKAVLSKGQHSLHEDADYTKLEESAGTDAGFRFFYNHAFSRKQSHCFNDKLGRTGLLDITNTAGWTELDIDFSPNEVTLNGYTLCDSSKMMRAITTQEPVELKFAESAPASTRAFAFLGISNREKFAANMMLSGETEEEREKYDRKLDINLMNSVTQLAAEELLVLYTSDNDTNATYGLVGINDQENCLKFLKETCDSVSACGANDSVFVYNDAAVFGAFTFHLYSFTPHCCALLNNYLLFAENPGDIQRYKADTKPNPGA